MSANEQLLTPLETDTVNAVAGSAGRLIFVHGSMDVGRSFRVLRKQFQDWETESYDRRGYGRSVSASALNGFGVDQQLDDLGAIIGNRKCVLFGHSLGSVFSLMAANRYPEQVRGVIAYEPPLPWLRWWPRPPLPSDVNDREDVRAAATKFMMRSMGENSWNALPESKRDRLLQWGTAWAEELVEFSEGGWPFEPQNVIQPVLILRGECADPRQVRGSLELSKLLNDAQLSVIPGAAHNAHTQCPVELAEAVKDFLVEVSY